MKEIERRKCRERMKEKKVMNWWANRRLHEWRQNERDQKQTKWDVRGTQREFDWKKERRGRKWRKRVEEQGRECTLKVLYSVGFYVRTEVVQPSITYLYYDNKSKIFFSLSFTFLSLSHTLVFSLFHPFRIPLTPILSFSISVSLSRARFLSLFPFPSLLLFLFLSLTLAVLFLLLKRATFRLYQRMYNIYADSTLIDTIQEHRQHQFLSNEPLSVQFHCIQTKTWNKPTPRVF